MDDDVQEVSEPNNARRTSKVNIEDSRFTVDGVYAEMIIEVDDTHDSPTKNCLNMELYEPKTSNNSSKMAFARKLGLGTISESSDDSSDGSDTTTSSESSAELILLEQTKRPEVSSFEHTDKDAFIDGKLEKKEQSEILIDDATPNEELVIKEEPVGKMGDPVVTKVEPEEESNAQQIEPKKLKVVLRKLPRKLSSGFGMKLHTITPIYEYLKELKGSGFLRSLFRLLYEAVPSDDADTVYYQVLQFNGFPFSRDSEDFNRKKELLDQFSITTLRTLAATLGIKESRRLAITREALNFLLFPYHESVVGNCKSFQPVIMLKRLQLDSKQMEQLEMTRCYDNRKILSVKEPTLQRVTRSSLKGSPTVLPKTRIRLSGPFPEDSSSSTLPKRRTRSTVSSGSNVDTSEASHKVLKVESKKRSSDLGKSKEPAKKVKFSVEPAKDSGKRKSKQEVKGANVEKVSAQAIKIEDVSDSDEEDTVPTVKLVKKENNKDTNSIEDNDALRAQPSFVMKRRTPEKRRKPSHYGDWINDNVPMKKLCDNSQVLVKEKKLQPITKIKKEPVKPKPAKLIVRIASHRSILKTIAQKELSDDLESNESANIDSDEDLSPVEEDLSPVEEDPPPAETQMTVSPGKNGGVKLGSFPQIVKGVQTITNCALQRLHVILFGTSSEPEVMKKNILSFNGFPFDKASEEYQQKHFFLSLSACNNLLEVFEALHIKIADASAAGLVDTLMQFLMLPNGEMLDKKELDATPMKVSPKKQKKKAPAKVAPKRRKVLMDDESVRKLELELAREQRARKRSETHIARVAPVPRIVPTLTFHSAEGGREQKKIRFADSPHIKFMIVALSYHDLDILHHLLYLYSASKSKIRRSILDFNGFSFDEDSPRFSARRTFLQRLGYRMVKRVAFILGLSTLDCRHPLNRLTDMVMMFLLSPSEMKQVPVKEFPVNFLSETPAMIDKKALLCDIPNMGQVLQMEFGNQNETCEYIVKSLSNAKLKGDLSNLKTKPMSVTGKCIPVAEVVTSDPVKISVQSSNAVKKPTSPIKPVTMLAVRAGDGQNASYHIVHNPPTTPAGEKLRMVKKSDHYILQPTSQLVSSSPKIVIPKPKTLTSASISAPNSASGTVAAVQKTAVAASVASPSSVVGTVVGVQKSAGSSSVGVPKPVGTVVAVPKPVVGNPVAAPKPAVGTVAAPKPAVGAVTTPKPVTSPAEVMIASCAAAPKPATSTTPSNVSKKTIGETTVKRSNLPVLPPGQTFLLDPSRLKVMSQALTDKNMQQNASNSSQKSLPTNILKKPVIAKVNPPEQILQTVKTSVSVVPHQRQTAPPIPMVKKPLFLPTPSPPLMGLNAFNITFPAMPTTPGNPPANATSDRTATGTLASPVLPTTDQFISLNQLPPDCRLFLMPVSQATGQTASSVVVAVPAGMALSGECKRSLNLADVTIEDLAKNQTPEANSKPVTIVSNQMPKPSHSKSFVHILPKVPPYNPVASVPAVVPPVPPAVPSTANFEVNLSDSENSDQSDEVETILPDNPDSSEKAIIMRKSPSDSELYERLLNIIHGADLTELTLKNIMEKLAMEYPGMDVVARRPFIKESVKDIICGKNDSPS